jgi:trk system potassium uptake protein
MRILIAGAGKAGRQLAMRLCEEMHSIVMIDTDQDALSEADAHLDILTICGSGSNPNILEAADLGSCDLCIAVTDSDEVNILTCLYANSAGVARKIARVRNPDYTHSKATYDLEKMGIDLVINQKRECTQELCNRLLMPGAFEVFDLFKGRVTIAGFRLTPNTPLVGTTPAECSRQDIINEIRMIAVRRADNLIIPYGDTIFQADDLLYIIGSRSKVSEFSEWVCPQFMPIKKVIIAGGGDLRLMLAKKAENRMECILLERNEERAVLCSAKLHKTLVLHGDALSSSTLTESGITERTAFVALTGDDEDNIMNCLMARKKGAGFTATGATVLPNLLYTTIESVPRGILFWRAPLLRILKRR